MAAVPPVFGGAEESPDFAEHGARACLRSERVAGRGDPTESATETYRPA